MSDHAIAILETLIYRIGLLTFTIFNIDPSSHYLSRPIRKQVADVFLAQVIFLMTLRYVVKHFH